MNNITKPYTFEYLTLADPNQVNANFDTLYTASNELITSINNLPTSSIVVSTYPSLADVITEVGSTSKTIIIDSAESCDTLTIPANIHLIITKEGSLTVNVSEELILNCATTCYGNLVATGNITINGAFNSGYYQVFTGSGTVSGLKEARPEWWGAAGDGVTDDTSALSYALTASSKLILGQKKDYVTTSGLTKTSDVTIIGNGSRLLPSSNFIALTLNYNSSTAIATTTATVPINVGESSITVSDATGITAGMLVKIRSDAEWYYETGRGYNKGELHLVDKVSGSVVYFKEPIYDSYEGTETVTVTAYNTGMFEVFGLTIEYPLNTITGGLFIGASSYAYIKNVSVLNASTYSVGSSLSINVTLEGCTLTGANDSPNGFGVSLTDTYDSKVKNCRISNAAFGIDLGTGTIPCRNNEAIGNMVIGGGFEANGVTDLRTLSIGIESHGASENCKISGNKINGCYRGVLAKGSHTEVSENDFINCVFDAVYFAYGTDLVVKNNRVLAQNFDRADVGSGATSTYYQIPQRFITVETTVSANTRIDVIGNKVAVFGRAIQLAGATRSYSNLNIMDNNVDLYGVTGASSVLFIGAANATTISKSRISGNSINVSQGVLTKYESTITVDLSNSLIDGYTKNGVTSVYTERLENKLFANAIPSAGTWVTNDLVWNATPSAGGYIGWICVSGGTPGTWKTFGVISP